MSKNKLKSLKSNLNSGRKLYLRFMDLQEIFIHSYGKFRVENFESRYLPFLKLKKYLDDNFPDKILIGKSFLGESVYRLKIGNGPIKVLAWSQMHGNESTGTRAVLDVIEFLKSDNEEVKFILNQVTFYFIPMLNPDGATLYTRRNAVGIDLNRDFLSESSPEIRLLKHQVDRIKPDYLLNLHDQRSIFNVGDSSNPSTLSFLAPSPDEERTQTSARLKAMSVINTMYKGLSKLIPDNIARFSDEFYPRSTGDNFIRLGIPCILFEAGHYPNDYSRNEVRKFFALAVLLALDKISNGVDENPGSYFDIPVNNKKLLDIILRNVSVISADSESLIDIGIYFEEKLDIENKEIIFRSKIEEIGDLSGYFGHKEFDLEGQVYIGSSSMFPVKDDMADFRVGIIRFENGKFIG